MGPKPQVPVELSRRAFTIADARRHGLTKDHLRSAGWRRLGRGVYAASGVADDPLVRLQAALLRLPAGAVFSGPTAAFLHGLDTRCDVIEVTIPPPSGIAHKTGIVIRRRQLAVAEVVTRKGFPVTSALRTVKDLVARLDLVEAVVVLDMALHKKLIRLEDVPCHREYVEPATESPMETQLRMLLVLAGLPRPQVQVSLGNETSFLGRVDLYYPDARLVIEYDGSTHRDSFAADNRRQNRLLGAGYRILRFSASDVLGSPEDVIALVRSALSEAGTAPLPMPPPRPARSARRPGREGPRAA